MHKRKSLKGFSLVELIVVIAIMAILVGILAPSLIRQLEKSKISKDKQLTDVIASAVINGIAEEYAYADFLEVCDNLPYSIYVSEIYDMSQQADGADGKVFSDEVMKELSGSLVYSSKGVKGKNAKTEEFVLVEIDENFNITVTVEGSEVEISVRK